MTNDLVTNLMLLSTQLAEEADKIEQLRDALYYYICSCEDGACRAKQDKSIVCGLPARKALDGEYHD
jgi:hypothetical protein